MEEVRLSAFDSWQKFDHDLHVRMHLGVKRVSQKRHKFDASCGF